MKFLKKKLKIKDIHLKKIIKTIIIMKGLKTKLSSIQMKENKMHKGNLKFIEKNEFYSNFNK